MAINFCISERAILQTKLALVLSDPHNAHLIHEIKKGETIVPNGDLIYKFSCAPVGAEYRTTELCYTHTPVVFENSSQ